MLTRLNFIQKSMRQLLTTFSLTFKQWGLLLSLPILLSLGISYAITGYVVHDKAREVGNFNLERLDELLLQSDSISEFAMTLKEGDCGKLREYMRFRPYYRGVLLFNDKTFYCSSMTGNIELPLNSLLPEYQLKDSARYIVPETPARLGVPAIIVISKDAQTHRGAIVVLEGQYLIDSFIQPEVSPRPVDTVVLGLHGATLPSETHFGEGEVVSVLADDKEFLILLEMSNAFFWHFFWIYFGILLPILFIFLLLSGLLLWRKKSRHSLADDIRSGIENEEFFLVYQPVISTGDGKAKGVEALVRWQHPQMGLVRPDLFIPIAEDSQLIVPLTNYIFERALVDFADMEVEAGFRIGFNVAPEHFIQSDIEAKFIHLRDSLARIGVKPLVEITERQLLTTDICQRIEGLRQLGVLVAIDDFGTGQTTLSLLQTMPLDYLKIDKCFIDTIGHESVTSHVLDTIIELSHKMNYVVVAEGVETQEQADYLTHRQVHFLQGYLFAKPMKLEDLKLWLVKDRLN
ncbi:EAL domain-containing protein [Shewanella sp. CG12_big_fil_rev_8_21_14_0_65_47_15]|uniref:EAL domain-containing protein n=1 Tax=Shewanella sp. CG12_big_fil_rev_8_21_14_0_65_47_15 TaxID=1975537 RepID=UPI000CBC2073|nr:EAL domain-containing protein [Shewanella sp. CG12_big_fil_rev_8_21_14_0_65_47_15]PIW62037.1 MAG: diguanylate phosphodiesterase [Shewanella sp. CG12_big_fil_rev_8_21_14_0_65_47_15]